MSGTGKSTALAELEKRGFSVVETDEAAWSEWSDADGGYVWREDRIAELLAREEGSTLTSPARCRTRGGSTLDSMPWFFSVLLPKCSFAALRRGRQTTTERAEKIATSFCATWPRLNLCYAQPAPTKWTRRSQSTSW